MKRSSGPYIFKRSGSWIMRYRETVNDAGELKTVQRAKSLCAGTISKKKARSLADKEVKKFNHRPTKPELIVGLGDFVTRVYLPFAETSKRFWTAKSYAVIWAKHFQPRPEITRKLLVDVRTCDVYRWLAEIAKRDRNSKGGPLSRNTLKRFKSLLSGIFTYARCNGYLDTPNPVEGALLPEAPAGAETFAYSLEGISAMLAVLPEPARTMAATAAFTGLSRSEIRGLTWEAFEGGELHVLRSIVAGRVQDTKTRARKAPVPLLPSLAQVLSRHRERQGNPETGPIFRTSNGTPLDPNNLLHDQMLPVLNRCDTCKLSEKEHTATVEHEYRRDESIPLWRGWHAFRRGLATNLHRLAVQDKTIQAILRHSNVAVTQACYIKTATQDSVRAMAALDSVLCSTCALESAVPAGPQV